MTPDEYRALDAVALDGLVAMDAITSAELRDVAVQVHELTDQRINAVVEWYRDPVDAQPIKKDRPALRGVPMLRKDYGSAEQGRLVEMGSRLAVGHRAESTAPFIGTLLKAGAQILGRSAVPEFIQHGVTESQVHGITVNPWDTNVSAGGSSGGAAAAVAAGVVPIAHASDCAGSIRIPAAACGLVGLKPGRGRVPWQSDWDGIAQEFVVSRTVRDSRRCLDVLGVGDYRDGPDSLSIALSTSHWAGFDEDPAVVAATQSLAGLLTAAGHRVQNIDPPVDYELLTTSWSMAFSRFALIDAERMARVTGRPVDETTLEPMTVAAIESVRSLTAAQVENSRRARLSAVAQLESALVGYDAILTPTLARSTIPNRTVGGEADPATYFELNDTIFPYNYLFNLSGWPSISVPGGSDDRGHPLGVQLGAPIGGEHVLLSLAATVERMQPWPLTAPIQQPGLR